METKLLTEKQYKTLSKNLINAVEKRYKVVALNSLQNANYVLKRSIYITIEVEKDVVIASLDDIEAFSYADTAYEAISGLCEEIISVYEDLKNDRTNLSVLPGKWLAFLDEIIEIK